MYLSRYPGYGWWSLDPELLLLALLSPLPLTLLPLLALMALMLATVLSLTLLMSCWRKATILGLCPVFLQL